MPWDHPKVVCSNETIEELYKECMQVFFDEVIAPSLRGTQHNKVFSIWGDDFSFWTSDYSYQYLTQLIKVFQSHSREVWNRDVIIKFATVQEYFDDVKALGLSFPTYAGDFIPYI